MNLLRFFKEPSRNKISLKKVSLKLSDESIEFVELQDNYWYIGMLIGNQLGSNLH